MDEIDEVEVNRLLRIIKRLCKKNGHSVQLSVMFPSQSPEQKQVVIVISGAKLERVGAGYKVKFLENT